jgi:hypothetical protein
MRAVAFESTQDVPLQKSVEHRTILLPSPQRDRPAFETLRSNDLRQVIGSGFGRARFPPSLGDRKVGIRRRPPASTELKLA